MKRLAVGIGCRRGASVEQIDAAVRDALRPHSIDEVRAVATIDIKANEPGIVEFCARYALPLHTFSREQIAAVAIAARTTPSAAVRAHLGVDGVCEPCALLAAPDGRLVIPKHTFNGVAVALADTVAPATVAHVPPLPHQQDPQ
ncbi:cobalamin biosynthesis protein [Paraburkholderia humisilvae]|uniref:Cobalt-precorrin-5A hydrolase n=1 Tax=Paraburkholderia humisilvae TaxID=627669 RepID=A0A6J5DFS7_9BURK|nr:cobalamin biosynthesis protein [Paraburkholderia humisilvae]CAB3752012.1 Cobalt-precorrin-5A hydrolase [Paraburkholderia humisilvae]